MSMVSLSGKFFIGQLSALESVPSKSSKRYAFKGIHFARICVQGIIVLYDNEKQLVTIDDGTGLVVVSIERLSQRAPKILVKEIAATIGNYIKVIGTLQELQLIAQQIMPLAQKPQRESLWILEVIDYWNAMSALSS